MANNQAANPWYLDTVADLSAISPVYCNQIIWTGGSAGDTCIILDHGGRNVFNETWPAGATSVTTEFGNDSAIWGLNLTQLDNGHVRVFIQ